MKKIQVILKGTNGDHTVTSPALDDDMVEEQWSTIQTAVAAGRDVLLPWIAYERDSFIVAHRVELPSRQQG